jgi:hypothetical protein
VRARPGRFGCLGQRVHGAVDLDPGVALGPQAGEKARVTAAVALVVLVRRRDRRDRREQIEPRPFRLAQQVVDDLLRRLPPDRCPADRAVRLPDPRPEQAQVVIDLGDRADRRPGARRGALLVDRHGRQQSLDRVHVGLVELAQELPCVARQRLHVATLALGEDRVEREARLSRPGQAGEHDHRVPGQVEIDVLEVVLAGAPDNQAVGHRRLPLRAAAHDLSPFSRLS